MPVEIKICGIRDAVAARSAVNAGADALGFVFTDSPRRVTPTEARDIAQLLPPGVRTVAVFHRPHHEEILSALRDFVPHMVQTEAETDVQWLLGRTRLSPVFHDGSTLLEDLRRYRARHRDAVRTVHLDAAGRGGRGRRVDWDRARAAARLGPLVLAGGLNARNVARAITYVRPAGVDVSSGVESTPGVKDPELMRAFCQAVREAGP